MTDSTICNSTGDWIIYQGSGNTDGAGNTITQTCASDDCNGDDIPDLIQIADGTFADCNGNSTPDTCELNDTLYASVDRTPDSPVDYIEFDVTTLGDAGDEVSLRIAALGERPPVNSCTSTSTTIPRPRVQHRRTRLRGGGDRLHHQPRGLEPGPQHPTDPDQRTRHDPDACAAPRTAIEVRVPWCPTATRTASGTNANRTPTPTGRSTPATNVLTR